MATSDPAAKQKHADHTIHLPVEEKNVIPWEEIDRAEISGHEGELMLLKRGMEISIRTSGTELMNSRLHSSEKVCFSFNSLPLS